VLNCPLLKLCEPRSQVHIYPQLTISQQDT
jgi:hypothetical protein